MMLQSATKMRLQVTLRSLHEETTKKNIMVLPHGCDHIGRVRALPGICSAG